MIEADLSGDRIAELLLAEVVGRELGPLGRLSVGGLDAPAQFTCTVGESYDLIDGQTPLATLSVQEDAVIIVFCEGDEQIRIDDGPAIKPAIDELIGRLTD